VTIADALGYYRAHSTKASDLARQLAFAGFGIVWVLRGNRRRVRSDPAPGALGGALVRGRARCRSGPVHARHGVLGDLPQVQGADRPRQRGFPCTRVDQRSRSDRLLGEARACGWRIRAVAWLALAAIGVAAGSPTAPPAWSIRVDGRGVP
jgi:hypothetical protein